MLVVNFYQATTRYRWRLSTSADKNWFSFHYFVPMNNIGVPWHWFNVTKSHPARAASTENHQALRLLYARSSSVCRFLGKRRRLCCPGISVSKWTAFNQGSQQWPGCQTANNSGNKYLWMLHLSQVVCLTWISLRTHCGSSGNVPSNFSRLQWPEVKFCHLTVWRCPLATLAGSREDSISRKD